MRKNILLILFVIVFVCELIAVQLKDEMLQIIFKPLLVPTIIGYFASQINITKGFSKYALIALLFSWTGDVLLMFQPKSELFFLFGLVSFLIGHIFYIIFFYKIKTAEQIKSNFLLLLIAAVYYATLIIWLFPYLAKMKMPVCVYGFIISIMFLLAMHLLSINNKKSGKQIFFGALLFVISDSVLAINKFYQPFLLANVVIMLTYGLAQFFIINGTISYLSNKEIVSRKAE